MSYIENKAKAVTFDNTPTLTDQAAAKDTDINVIVGQFLIHGQAPGNTKQGMYEDFTQLPDDFRGYLDLLKTMEATHAKLPNILKAMNVGELLALTPDQLANILTPAKQPEEPKAE